jgi:hypothetical protein
MCSFDTSEIAQGGVFNNPKFVENGTILTSGYPTMLDLEI